MHERLASLFFPHGAPAGLDGSDPERSAEAALSAAAATATDAQGAELRRSVAEQLLTGDSPSLEAAAVRLLDAGRGPAGVWNELELALTDAVSSDPAATVNETAENIEANLELLPLPTFDEIFDAYLEFATTPIPLEELDDLVASRFGLELDIPLVRRAVESVQDVLIRDEVLVLLGDDLAVDPEKVLADLVLTTRVGRRRDRLVLDADLAALGYLFEPDRTADGDAVDVAPDFARRIIWHGPPGWLSDFAEDELVCVRLRDDAVHVERAPVAMQEADLTDPDHADLVRLLRERYDEEITGAGLPLSARELVVMLRAADPKAFRVPAPPFVELCRGAGLEVRGGFVAAGPEPWARQRWSALLHQVFDEFDDGERERVMPLVQLYGTLVDGDEVAPEKVREAVVALAEPAFTLSLLRLLGAEDDPDALDQVAHLADVLRPAATRARHRAAAAWLDARVAARRADPLRAEVLLRDVLVDDPDNADVLDELAWYRSDRGDADGARTLWQQLEQPPETDLDALPEPGGAEPKLRRNEPCWCGSGRKYKACHLRFTDRLPLPDRFGWLLRKPVSFLQRRSGRSVLDMAEAASLLSGGERDAFAEAWSDPLAADVVLAEFGWLQRFLAERGDLLPDDERLLVTSWLLAERTVAEVVSADARAGLVRVRDLRTGDEHEVLDRTFSQTARRSELLCTRLLDDGERKRLSLGVFTVPPGREDGLLRVLDLEDPRERGEAVLSWMAAASAPPRLTTREGEPLMLCRARIGPVDPDEATDLFDEIFEPGSADDQWHETQELSPGEVILRGMVTLNGSEVEIETNSKVRLDRLIGRLLDDLPEAALLDDERRPIPTGRPSSSTPPAAAPLAAGTQEALEQFVEQQELRWCDEDVPALDGLTPREAAADPTRREKLERLVASMPDGGVSPLGFASMRPGRLRELLGLR